MKERVRTVNERHSTVPRVAHHVHCRVSRATRGTPGCQVLESRTMCTVQTETVTVEDLSDGCGAKIDVLVVSDKFEGVALLDRQRAVHSALEDEMKTIHAITMKCKTVKQWQAMQNQ